MLILFSRYGGWYSDLDTVTVNSTDYINWNMLCNTGGGHLG